MKMSYLLKSSNLEERKKNTRKKIWLVTLVLFVLVVVLITKPLRDSILFIAEPILKVRNYVLSSNFFEYFKSKQTLIDERVAVEQRLFLAGDLLAINQTLQSENDVLKDLLGRKDVKLPTILGAILNKPPFSPYDTLIIDVGVKDGVKVGDKIIANANVYIGEVSEVYPQTSKVILYSTPGQKLSVIVGANSITTEAVGMGGGNFNIFLPREEEIIEGDIINLPSITTNVFGIVEKVNFQDKDSFQTILFKSPVNISELNFVEVVRN
jgi:cell shape-determining protein MreC